MSVSSMLPQLGWRPFFQQQLSLEEWEELSPVRVVAQHRSRLQVLPERSILSSATQGGDVTVGDWLLVSENGTVVRLLDRLSVFSRKAAGSAVALQLIAANIDTAFIVCAMDFDFNVARIERFIVLARDSGVEPVVVLSKADQCEDTAPYLAQITRLDASLSVVAVNALDVESVISLNRWLGEGNTVALLGSSGVGKSTLVNTMMGSSVQDTGGIREDDSKGRHTTTGRSLHLLPTGGLLLDTPGMRELQLANVSAGVQESFHDVTSLAATCRFSDCDHSGEPGCAVLAAIDAGLLQERRLLSFRKLNREQAFNSATLAEKRARDRNRGKKYRAAQSASRLRNKRGS